MDHTDIKQQLRAVRDGELDEARRRQWKAWTRLRPVLFSGRPAEQAASGGGWVLTWGAAAVIAVTVAAGVWIPSPESRGVPFAIARQPQVYTATFYSPEANADVVWITGLQSSTDTGNLP